MEGVVQFRTASLQHPIRPTQDVPRRRLDLHARLARVWINRRCARCLAIIIIQQQRKHGAEEEEEEETQAPHRCPPPRRAAPAPARLSPQAPRQDRRAAPQRRQRRPHDIRRTAAAQDQDGRRGLKHTRSYKVFVYMLHVLLGLPLFLSLPALLSLPSAPPIYPYSFLHPRSWHDRPLA